MIEQKGDKKFQYQMYATFLGLILGYIIIFRVFSVIMLSMSFTLVDIFLFGIPIFLVLYLAILGPMRNQLKYQRKGSKIEWNYSFLKRSLERPEEFYLPFAKVFKLEVDFNDTSSLEDKLKSEVYPFYYREYLKQQVEKKVNTIRDDPKYISVIKALKDLKKKNLNPEEFAKRMQELAQKEHVDMKKALSMEEFTINFSSLREDEKLNEILKTFKLYYVILEYEQVCRNGESFNQLFLLMPGEYGELLKTGPGEGSYNGWWIDVQECFAYWTYWRDISKNAQLWVLHDSENMSETSAELIKNLSAEAGTHIELKVLETWNNHLESRPRKLQLENNYLKQKAKTFEYAYSDLIQDNANRLKKYGFFNSSSEVLKERARTDKYKKRSLLFSVILGFTIIIAIILIIFSIIVF